MLQNRKQSSLLSLDVTSDTVAKCSENLLRLAIVVDKNDCGDALELHLEALLSHFAQRSVMCSSSLRSLTKQTSAAYLFRNHCAFALFTRHLVMDGTVRDFDADEGAADAIMFPDEVLESEALISRFRHQPGCCVDVLHAFVEAWQHVAYPDPACKQTYSMVHAAGKAKLVACQRPLTNTEGLPLREIVQRFMNQDVEAPEVPLSHCSHDDPTIMTKHQLKRAGWVADDVATGLCLACLLARRSAHCTHHEILISWAEDDPTIGVIAGAPLPAGWVESNSISPVA